MALVLLYEMDREKEKAVGKLGAKLKVRVKHINPPSYGETIGYLAEISGFSRRGVPGGKPFGREMLVFSGMDSELLDAFLDGYRKSGLPPIELKAAVTPQNVFWDSRKLFEELLREHEQFTR